MTSSTVHAWLLASRPKTLTAILAPVLVGTSLVIYLGYSIHWWVVVCAFLSGLGIQIGTNLFNDALDFLKGTDTHERLGPTRVTQSALLSSQAVLFAAVFSFAIAALCAIPLIVEGGWPIVVIGLLSFIFGYGYTGGPFPLSYLGISEIFVVLFFGFVAVGGISYLQIMYLSKEALVAGLQMGLLSTIMLAVNNLRDVEGDCKAGKKSFAVRFGVAAAKKEIICLCLLPFILNIFWFAQGSFLAALLPFFSLPLAFKVIKSIMRHSPSKEYNRFLAQGAALNLLFAVLLSLGLLWS